jgi:hypothetical protein
MIYLTKTEDGQLHHFQAIAEENGVEVIEGICYISINKYYLGCADRDAINAKQQELVQKKLAEGFLVIEFVESLENTEDVYDKAKYHFGGDFPAELDPFQGYIHTCLYLGWLLEHDMMSEEFTIDNAANIQLFRNRELTGPQLFEAACDGVLLLDDLNETGNRFSLPYFNFDNGKFLSDYETTLGTGLPMIYHVQDTRHNFKLLTMRLDRRLNAWNERLDTSI